MCLPQFKHVFFTSGKKFWGNFAFSFVETDSMLPEYTSFPVHGTNFKFLKSHINTSLTDSCMKYKFPKA